MLSPWLLTLVALCAPPLRAAGEAPAAVDPPNILLVVIDDLGYDLLADACTPTLHALGDRGLTLANFYAAPTCSPARAALLTGLYGHHTGVGRVINGSSPYCLPQDSARLPGRLPRHYATAAIGKWHLCMSGSATDLDHPNDVGFDWFAGQLDSFGLSDTYWSWPLIVNGQLSSGAGYVTSAITDLAIEQMRHPAPWFVYVAHHAPHGPHVPANLPPPDLLNCGGGIEFPRQIAYQMLEALDAELGRLLDAVPPRTYVFVLSDNGTPASIAPAADDPAHYKGSVYQPGIRVPAWVLGPGVPVATIEAPVCMVDIPATIAELAGVPFRGDGVSIAPYLRGVLKPVRSYAYAELFRPNQPPGVFNPSDWERTVISADGWKLIRRLGQPDELYDLNADPRERTPVTHPQRHAELLAEMQRLGVD